MSRFFNRVWTVVCCAAMVWGAGLTGCASNGSGGSAASDPSSPFSTLDAFVPELKAFASKLLAGTPAAEASGGLPHLVPADRLAEITGEWKKAGGKSLMLAELEVTIQFCQDGKPTQRFELDVARFKKLGVTKLLVSSEPADPAVCEGKTTFWSSRGYQSAAPAGRWDALGALARRLGDALSDTTRCMQIPTVDWSFVAPRMPPGQPDPKVLGAKVEGQMRTACATPGQGKAVYARFDDVHWAAMNEQGKIVGTIKTELNYAESGLEFELLRWSPVE